jgi:murein L,D-transpeptidase YcbB/YkuD
MRTTLPSFPSRHHRIGSGASGRPVSNRVGGALRGLRRTARAAWAPGDSRRMVPAAPAAVVQERLRDISLLAPAGVTRRWDRPTVQAVEDFQRARGLTVDGIAGPATVDLLLAA